MWVIFAVGSAFFAGITAILSKMGVKDTDSDVVTFVRTFIVLIFSWLMVVVTGVFLKPVHVSCRELMFLLLSGIATGASWICYFRALQLGDVNKVTPIDKSSTVLSMLLAIIFLREELSLVKIACMIAIGVGTYMMIAKQKQENQKKSDSWLFYAVGSAVFASLTSILGKVGVSSMNSNLGTAIRTIVVLIMAGAIVAARKKMPLVKKIDKTSCLFIVLSGIATGASWLCYYRALQTGPASVVVPIDKLSILVTIAFSYVVLGERLTKKSAAGLILIVAGTLALLL